MSNHLSVADLSILAVEPSGTQRRIIVHALEHEGVRNVYEATDGQQALALLSAHRPDLILSSMYLPDMTGTDLIHAIRKGQEYADTPFLLISSETRFRYLDPIRQAGAVGILPKPFAQDELQTALRTTLDLVDIDMDMDDDNDNLRVLVVDDSTLAQRHISRVLNGMGITDITLASDGVEALELVNRNYYDFVVTDYNMPHMDGKELIDRIRTSSNQASIPILMVTSEDNASRLAAVQHAGVSAICDKPFEPAAVRRLVRSFVA